jgi:uncharacterized protein involved in outer membrane biogenesis
MKQDIKRIATRVFLGGIAVVLLYALAGFFLAPYLMERYLPSYAQAQLGSRATIGNIRINPFLLRLETTDFRLEHPPGRPMVAFGRLWVDFQLSSLFRRAWTFADVQIDGLALYVEVQRDGSLNVAAFTDRVAKRYADVSSGERPPRRWLVQHAALRAGKVTFNDLSGPTPAGTTFAPIDLEVRDLATLPDRHGRYAITATVPDGGSIAWRGEVSVLPIASAGELEVKGLQLATPWAFARNKLRVSQPGGRVDLAARYHFAYADGKATLGLDGIRAQVSAFALSKSGSAEPILALDTIAASEGRFDLAKRELVVPKLELRNGRVAATVGADRTLDWASLLAPMQRSSSAKVAPSGGSESRPWKYTIQAIEVENVNLAVVDRGYEQPIAYGADIVSATLQTIANHGSSPMRFEAALTTAQGGTIKGAGTIAQGLETADAQVEATAVALTPLQPFIARYAALDLKSGHASASARVNYRGGGKGPSLSATGTVSIENVLVNEARTGDRFLSWKTLSADEVAFTLAPNRLAIKEVRVLEPGAKVAISKDGEVNLAQVLGPDARRANGPAASDRKERAAATISRRAPEESAGDAFTADIGRVRVRNGTVDFSDRSLALPFSARVRRFNGSAVGISTDRASRAELKFEGRIEGSGSAKVEGGLNAFDPRAFTDVRVEFDNVEMPPLSPYAATFAGRKIASGRLWLDLRYKIVKSELAGENKIVMQDFTLGERVEAPNALDLPLDLAVTLLTNSQGRINVAVPVRGNIDNPQFSYRHLIREALASLIVRIVSAPFRALAGVFGSGAETLGSINFEPGRARLLPPEQEKLDRVVQALKDKPQVKLIVRGPYDPQLDGEALRNRQVRREVAQALGVKLEQREDPGPIAYSDAATQRALETMLAARTGTKAAAELEREFKKNAGRDPERVSRLLALFGKASPDREFYQALFQRLVESYPLPETELQRLATRRAEAITEYLVQSAGLDPGRVEAGDARTASASDQTVAAELSLGLVKGVSASSRSVSATPARGASRRRRDFASPHPTRAHPKSGARGLLASLEPLVWAAL